MNERDLQRNASETSTNVFTRELGHIRNGRRISEELTSAFRTATSDLAERRDWEQVARIAVRYAIKARRVNNMEALDEGVRTVEGAAIMGGRDKIRRIIAEERHEKTRKRREQRRRQV